MDRCQFNNEKYDGETTSYKFVFEYVEGELNVWSDMPTREHGLKKSKLQVDFIIAGKTFTFQISSLRIYVPSWWLCVSNGEELLPQAHLLRSTSHWCFFAYHITSTILVARHRSR